MDTLYYLFVILAFFAVVMFIEGTFLVWNAYKGPEAKRVEKRLRAMSAVGTDSPSASFIKQRLLSKMPFLDRILLEVPRIHTLDRLLQQSCFRLSVAGFLGLTLVAVAVGFILSLLFHFFAPVAFAVCVATGCLPLLYILKAKSKRMNTIEQQLPGALDLMARGMQAGHAFPSALKMVGDECPEPVAGEFHIVFDEINYGISAQDALVNLTKRVPSADLQYFVISVLIQRGTGGNLAELLGNISTLIRERQKLLGAVRVLSAEGRLSAWILSLLPFVLAFVIHAINPGFLSVLFTDPVGPMLIGGALVMMVLGIIWMRRIIRIRV